ncbi:putative vacuolar amino acid transporter YPQ3 [Cladobotryum mycophilum]|uniref:Vacuolar amino acid transporter YPQ3 n=1 Tax=Cladobotryum mycophilum TaxID=491253 RepID=A0ABR0SS08_9HYPO
MASIATSVMEAAAKQLPFHTIISGIFGSISMAAWLCVILPQMVVNYRNKSAEALSVPFLIVWMLGDATNLIGGLLTNIAPTAIILAMYFCVSDVMIISQTIYYNTVNARRAEELRAAAEAAESSEEAPLLARRNTSPHRRADDEPASKGQEAEAEGPVTTPWTQNALALSAVYAAGILGWFISYKAGAWQGVEHDMLKSQEDNTPLSEQIGMIIGYISAVCYLFARIPQIIKNYKSKSCQGLAILFFMLSSTANLTYAVSIVSFSQDKKYLVNIVPWLLGSLGTVSEDIIIFFQFHYYSTNRRSQTTTAA